MAKGFLPTTWNEGAEYYKNFSGFDIIFISGDPYYDHPLNGVSIIARLLDAKGYRVAIIPQPLKDEDYKSCGKARFFFCISSGLLDSMLANYTPMLHKRENVLVPERALMVYTQKVKEAYKGCMTVLGGVEATLRRFTHFDYRTNELRRGILNDTKADLCIFGNGDRSILNVLEKMKTAKRKEKGTDFEKVRDVLNLKTIDGIAFRIKKEELNEKIRKLPSYEECMKEKKNFTLLTRMHFLLPEAPFTEGCGLGIIQHNRSSHTLQEKELDLVYELPFTRELHPKTKNMEFQQEMLGKLDNSVVIGRGCWGSCTFCVIPLVQGKEVAKRSKESILREIESLYKKGVKKINDLTLPTLNMYGSYCALYDTPEKIQSPVINEEITVYNKPKYCNQQCVGCKYRKISNDLVPILEGVEQLQKKYTETRLELRSAIRHDIILDQKEMFRKMMKFITRLKIAPEHLSPHVLKQMNKSNPQAFKEFIQFYKQVNKEQKSNKHLVPYFLAAHPGTTRKDMEDLRKFCEKEDMYVNLTQVFTPTPGTVATAMYYTEENPLTKEKVYVPRTFREKKDQKNILLDTEEEVYDENG
ncbi:MAG: hypothetical protein QT08_C0008G0053 [archaeon GW2011_AR17]|nr:MAG: hypothetical protein QT08_C0008G0053 [archaeon GW2011_AR17]MBS3153815.1 DUF3362 domain-containing protein [Candidatus Woesearchaeota archaeon]HIH15159.1 DUF3362 domain-containing protein [Nanoarchaeota archaeon]HIH59425.1 DUF3362 domain-containing protein [Nanoarchaeota archaeon]HII13823.1 DUF3362 domain-containing protein [Nanoarchaeota archaeon]